MAPSVQYLLLLPVELVLGISDHLPLDGILALKLTHRILNDGLPTIPRLRNGALNACSRFAIERLRASPGQSPERSRCILCKMVYPSTVFASSNSPACLPVEFEQVAPRPEVVEIPRAFCSWHVGSLAKVIRTEPGGRNEWVSDVKKMCMHNGCIQGWHECHCGCSSCGHKMIRTYTRFLNNNVECKKFYFWRNAAAGASEDPREKAAGRLYVQEVCGDSGATSEKSIIQLPVHYRDMVKTDCGLIENRTRSDEYHRRKTSFMDLDHDKFTATGVSLCTMF